MGPLRFSKQGSHYPLYVIVFTNVYNSVYCGGYSLLYCENIETSLEYDKHPQRCMTNGLATIALRSWSTATLQQSDGYRKDRTAEDFLCHISNIQNTNAVHTLLE